MVHTDPITAPQENPTIPTELFIPEISDDRLVELYSHIKPLFGDNAGNKYTLRESSLDQMRNTSYYWEHEGDRRDIINTDVLDPIQDFYCLHRYGYYALFKPSIAEVLAQMPEDIVKITDFFEIIERPETVDDLNKHKTITDAGFHLSKVRAYRLKG